MAHYRQQRTGNRCSQYGGRRTQITRPAGISFVTQHAIEFESGAECSSQHHPTGDPIEYYWIAPDVQYASGEGGKPGDILRVTFDVVLQRRAGNRLKASGPRDNEFRNSKGHRP